MPTISPRNQATGASDVVPARTTVQANTNMKRPNPPAEISPPDTHVVAETTPAPAVTLSPQASALARREAQFRKQQAEFEAQKKAFEEKQKDYVPLSELQQNKGSALLKRLGRTYEDLTSELLNEQQGADPTNQALQELSEKVNTLESSISDSQKKQIDGVIKQYESEISKLVDSNPEFETIKARKAEGFVLQHILDTFNDPEDGEILTVDQAAREIEELLLDDAIQVAQLKKVQAKLAPKAPEEPQHQEKKLPPPAPPREPKVQSISNDLVATSTRSYQQMQHLSPRERLGLAIKKAQDKANQR